LNIGCWDDKGAYISRQQRVTAEGPAFAFVVGVEDYENVFDCHHHGQGPDDNGQHSYEVIVRGLRREGRRVDIERTCANIAVDDADGLVCKP
jgi:hypothetical protein